MNKKLGLAVAGAVMALSSAAQAGITIPAGEWTLDIGGVVNAYYTTSRVSGDFEDGNVATDGATLGGTSATGRGTETAITTGLLPNYLIVSGKSRQNDLDVGFTISMNPGASRNNSGQQSAQQENRQAFLTIGDASWGSVKLGKDLGVYAGEAILHDMTLLGVGSGAAFLSGNTTTLGRIGTGFIYADWKAQITYTSPNWNGFEFKFGVSNPWNAIAANATDPNSLDASGAVANTRPWGTFNSAVSNGRGGNTPAFEGQVSYALPNGGKVWASGFTQRVRGLNGDEATDESKTARAFDIGANVNLGQASLTAYVSNGHGSGTTVLLRDGFDRYGKSRSSTDWYLQGTYVLPTSTKLGVSYGKSWLKGTNDDDFDRYENRMWTVGAYHPITKSVNLVAEYSDVRTTLGNWSAAEGAKLTGSTKTMSLGAILFF